MKRVALAVALLASFTVASAQDLKCARDMTWRTELHEALVEAKAKNKLVFWVQMLGKMDGKT